MDWTAIIVALIAGGFLTEIFRALINGGKPKAELNDLFSTTAAKLVKTSNEQNEIFRKALQDQIDDLKAEITEKDIEATIVNKELEALRTANKEKDEKIGQLEADYLNLKQENEDLKRRYIDLEQKYRELTGEGCSS